MRAPHLLRRRIAILALFLIPLLTIACGTFEVGIERTATPDQSAEATVAALPTENAPVATPTPYMDHWITYSNPSYAISLQYPSDWQPVPGYGDPETGETRLGAENGFFHVSAMDADTIDRAAARHAGHHLQPYGSQPVIEDLQVQGQEARLILPSADQPAGMDHQAALIVRYPRPVTIAGRAHAYRYFVLWADEAHIRTIAHTLRFNAGSPSAAAATPAPPATWENPPPTPGASVTPAPGSPPGGLELPRSLYFLSINRGPFNMKGSRSVWRLAPGDTGVERATPPDLWITSFDVWPDDGRIAYATRDGQLYVAIPGREPRLLYDTNTQVDDAVEIDSVAWSPEGARLAYTVQYLSYDPGSPGEYDGLWLLTLDSDTPVKLLNNRHLEADYSNINDARNVSDPVWSPDGAALILTGHYWEWIDVLWLDPVAPDLNETNLHRTYERTPDQCPQCADFLDQFWTYGSWANDGVQSRASGSILLSGANYGDFSDLVRVRRDLSASERLIDGEVEGLYVYNAQELPAGIAFLARPSGNPQETRLYLGRQAEDGFRYAPVGPDHALCSPGYVRDVAWDPAGCLAVLSCDRGAQLISLDETDVSGWVDLTPFLGPLAGEDHLQVFWGPSRKSDLPTHDSGRAVPTTTGTWITYTDSLHRFSLQHPPEFDVSTGDPGDPGGFIGEKIDFSVGESKPYWVRCLYEAPGDCPVIEMVETTLVAGQEATRIRGYIGAIGGNIPQQYVTYIATKDDVYYVFTLYAVGRGHTDPADMTIRPLVEEDVVVFEQIMGTLQFFE